MKRLSPLLLTLILIAFPLAVFADPIIPCGAEGECTFQDLFVLIQNVISFLLFKLAVPLAAIAFAWAGILFVVYSGNEGKRSEAKSIIWYAIIGLALALAAWLIVDTIFGTLTTIEINPQTPL